MRIRSDAGTGFEKVGPGINRVGLGTANRQVSEQAEKRGETEEEGTAAADWLEERVREWEECEREGYGDVSSERDRDE